MKVLTWEQVGLPVASPVLEACTITNAGLVYTSGCVGVTNEGIVVEGVEGQTEAVIENLRQILKAAGTSLDKVVKALVFVARQEDIPIVNAVYAKHFTNKPPRSCVVAQLAGDQFKVEIEVVAEI
ncbi:hypothetical protein CANINC_003169 [Pichia inconspicua]|uniref:Uncharacterized protein n=1 Tax=Pichia inconspicua TaxID=52247 RepID=A0A4T0WZT4_9ASCO|nr:hypothetical protein CANINC_003169 [[Candida] inconspicua]